MVKILKTTVDSYSQKEALEKIGEMIKKRTPHLVVTANPEIIYRGYKSPYVQSLLDRSSLTTADGSGVLLAAKILGKEVPVRLTGVALSEALVAASEETKWRIFFLGAAPGVAKKAALRLKKRYPQANIVGTMHGYFGDDLKRLKLALSIAKPDILLVAMGSPKQEELILQEIFPLRVPVSMGVGGSFDVFSGRVKRAPIIWQNLHLEWLYRLLKDPRRWRRFMTLPLFVLAVIKSRFRIQ